MSRRRIRKLRHRDDFQLYVQACTPTQAAELIVDGRNRVRWTSIAIEMAKENAKRRA